MRDLNWDLLQLQRRASFGSHATRRDRSYALAQMANALHELGYRGLRASGLKGKHIEALVRDWSDRGLSDATMMNRMAHVRWWADQVGKGNMVKANAEYGIRSRSHVSDGARRRDLDEGKLALVKDVHVRMALRLQAGFGLRREEAIKFSPSYADRGDRIAVKASTAKGGRAREVPILKDSQRRLLEEARRLAGGGAMIPPERNYAEQKTGVRGADEGGGPRSHAWPAPRVRARPLRGACGVEGAGGGRTGAAQPDGGEAAHRRGGAHAGRARARAWPHRNSASILRLAGARDGDVQRVRTANAGSVSAVSRDPAPHGERHGLPRFDDSSVPVRDVRFMLPFAGSRAMQPAGLQSWAWGRASFPPDEAEVDVGRDQHRRQRETDVAVERLDLEAQIQRPGERQIEQHDRARVGPYPDPDPRLPSPHMQLPRAELAAPAWRAIRSGGPHRR